MLDYKLFEQSRRLVFDVIGGVGRIGPCISSFRYSDKDGRLSNSRGDPGLSMSQFGNGHNWVVITA